MKEDGSEERVDWSRLESRRRERARKRKKRRKALTAAFVVAAVVAVGACVYFLGPWRPGDKAGTDSPGNVVKNDVREQAETSAPENGGREGDDSGQGNGSDASAPAVPETGSEPTAAQDETPVAVEVGSTDAPAPAMRAPTNGPLLYPFTESGSTSCGKWSGGSLDFPYFGAPRSGGRLHGAVDIYPAGATAEDGGGQPVYAIKDGTVVKVMDNFYTRANGERTKAVLVDHGDFVACYCEIRGQPNVKGSALGLGPGQRVTCGQLLGYISGTEQLHLEMYAPGTPDRFSWYGGRPSALLDPTDFMLDLYGLR